MVDGVITDYEALAITIAEYHFEKWLNLGDDKYFSIIKNISTTAKMLSIFICPILCRVSGFPVYEKLPPDDRNTIDTDALLICGQDTGLVFDVRRIIIIFFCIAKMRSKNE